MKKTDVKRKYVDSALTIASHPARRKILKLLSDKPGEIFSTKIIREKLDIERYALYHHLEKLKKYKLILKIEENKSAKLKFYKINYPNKPNVASLNYSNNEIDSNKNDFNKIYKIIEKLEKYNLPDTEKISSIEILLKYDWDKDE
jgi:DNA-binding transcriptional ArsR family regulator